MSKHITADHIKIIITIIGSAAAAGSAVIGILLKWGKHKFISRDELFDKDGKPLYQSLLGCNVMHDTVKKDNSNMCKKFDEMKNTVEGLITKADNARQEGRKEIENVKLELVSVKTQLQDLNATLTQEKQANMIANIVKQVIGEIKHDS